MSEWVPSVVVPNYRGVSDVSHKCSTRGGRIQSRGNGGSGFLNVVGEAGRDCVQEFELCEHDTM